MGLLTALAAAAMALVPAIPLADDLTAVGVRAADHPASVRIVLDFADGDLARNDPTLLDPEIWKDGATRLEIAHRGISTEVRTASVLGVRAELVQGRDRLLVRIVSAPHRFKYVSYRALDSPERLLVDLWKAGVPAAGAAVRDDGCLRVTHFTGGPESRWRGASSDGSSSTRWSSA